MALQWMILAYVVAAEAGVAILLTLPSPKALKSRIVSMISLILQPSLFVIPFSAFQLLDIYWKNEHRLMCTGEICTAAERDRYERSGRFFQHRLSAACTSGFTCIPYFLKLFVKHNSEGWILSTRLRGMQFCVFQLAFCIGIWLTILIHLWHVWCIYRICKYHREIQSMEEVEKRYKDQ